MDIKGEKLEQFKISVALAKDEFRRRFPLLELICAEKACSGCLIPLFSALSSLEEEGRKMERALDIVVGLEADGEEGKECIFIGDCTQAYWEKGPHLEGCPPDKEDLLQLLRKKWTKRE